MTIIKNEMENQTKPMRMRVREMEVGDTISFNIQKANLIKDYSSVIGLIYKRKYTTRIARDEDRIYITRIS